MGRQSLCYGKIGEKFWGAEKTGLLILPGKQKKKFRDLVALEQGLEGQRTSLHSRQERKLQTHRSSTCKVTKKKEKEKEEEEKSQGKKKKLQRAQYLHHLTTWRMTHLQPSGSCLRSILSPLGLSSPVTVLSHILLGLWGFIKIYIIKIDLVLEALIS